MNELIYRGVAVCQGCCTDELVCICDGFHSSISGIIASKCRSAHTKEVFHTLEQKSEGHALKLCICSAGGCQAGESQAFTFCK